MTHFAPGIALSLLLLGGCSSRQSTVPDVGADSRRRDLPLADQSPIDALRPDRAREVLPQYDLGADPDINLGLCKDASFALPDTTLGTSLLVTPELKWKTLLSTTGYSSVHSVFQGDDKNIYATSAKKGIYAVSAGGKLLWSYPVPPIGSEYIQAAMPMGDQIFFGSGAASGPAAAWVHGITTGGVALFSKLLPGPYNPYAYGVRTSRPARAKQADTFHIGVADGFLYTLDTAGNIKNATNLASDALRHLLVDEAGTIYTTLFPDKKVAAISPTGTVLWNRTAVGPNSGSVSGMALTFTGDLVVLGSVALNQYTSAVIKLDRACGSERWRTLVPGTPGQPVLVDVDGTIYIRTVADKGSSGQGKDSIAAISSLGKVKWTAELEDSGKLGNLSYYSFGPIGADGTLYVVIVNDGPSGNPGGPSRVRAYSTTTGKELWNVPIPGVYNVEVLRDPVLLANGLLIFGGAMDEATTTNMYLIAVQTKSPGLAKSAWPRGQHDNQNSANLASPLW